MNVEENFLWKRERKIGFGSGKWSRGTYSFRKWEFQLRITISKLAFLSEESKLFAPTFAVPFSFFIFLSFLSVRSLDFLRLCTGSLIREYMECFVSSRSDVLV